MSDLKEKIKQCLIEAYPNGLASYAIARKIGEKKVAFVMFELKGMRDICSEVNNLWYAKPSIIPQTTVVTTTKNTDWLNSPPEIEINDEYRKAIGAAVRGESMFITGKAGTGKTVLLKLLYATLKERGQQVAIAAPTGVAAKNAGGVTIHSLLHLPIGPFLPGHKKQGLYSLAKANVEVIKVIDTLIIDEISMVRCDLLDEVDDVLRHYRDSEAPFGGVQLILIGDLYQLIPVAEKDEWDILKGTYRDPYFFNSKALEQIKYRLIELNKVYRQEDDEFIKALNRIRLGYCLDIDQALFNTRYQPAFTDRNSEYVWLTTHNYLAKREIVRNWIKSIPKNLFSKLLFMGSSRGKMSQPVIT